MKNQKYKSKEFGYIVRLTAEHEGVVYYSVNGDKVDSPSSIFYKQFVKI